MSLPKWKTRHCDGGEEWNTTYAADAASAAEVEAETYCNDLCDGQSPVRIEVDGHGLFDVEIEAVPIFTAKPVKQEIPT